MTGASMTSALAQSKELLKKTFLTFPNSPKRLLLAVSGGRDSATLLCLLSQFRKEFSLELAVAHVDHSLRENSASDAQFVEDLAAGLGLPFYLKRLDGDLKGQNLETWARERRYEALEEFRVESGSDVVVTAHHAGDQAETILFRILTGRTPKGMTAWCGERKLFRPMLQFPKTLVDELQVELDVHFVEDETNSDLRRSRNKLRQQLLPLLRSEYNPRVDAALVDLAQRFTEVETHLDEEARDSWEARGEGFSTKELQKFSTSLRWRLLREQAASEVGERARSLSSKTFEEINSLIEQDLGFGISVKQNSDGQLQFYSRIENTNSLN